MIVTSKRGKYIEIDKNNFENKKKSILKGEKITNTLRCKFCSINRYCLYIFIHFKTFLLSDFKTKMLLFFVVMCVLMYVCMYACPQFFQQPLNGFESNLSTTILAH